MNSAGGSHLTMGSSRAAEPLFLHPRRIRTTYDATIRRVFTELRQRRASVVGKWDLMVDGVFVVYLCPRMPAGGVGTVHGVTYVSAPLRSSLTRRRSFSPQQFELATVQLFSPRPHQPPPPKGQRYAHTSLCDQARSWRRTVPAVSHSHHHHKCRAARPGLQERPPLLRVG
jgi:hypothetical protein